MNARSLFAAVLLAAPLLAVAKDDPEVLALQSRLSALQGNPETGAVARYEQLQAQQAIAAFADARRRDREDMKFLADRRLEIAEVAARTALARHDVERLDATRNELLIEASRQEAARARQEADRLRMQSQMQAEEAERLRLAAESETLARQDAELALSSVATRRAAKLSDAQQKAAQLAREEAELVAGAKLPASKFESRGEVFSVADPAYAGATLSAEGQGQAKALAEYLQIGKKGRVNLIGYGESAKARAEALRDALAAAGVSGNRLQASAGKGSSKGRAVEVIVVP